MLFSESRILIETMWPNMKNPRILIHIVNQSKKENGGMSIKARTL